MKKDEAFSIKKRVKSFRYAINGLLSCIMHEHNARIHIVAMLMAITLGFVFHISLLEWLAISIVIGMVLITELLNTAIERLVDFVEPQWNDKVGLIKDYCAAAVLIASLIAIVVGILVFVPKIAEKMGCLICM